MCRLKKKTPKNLTVLLHTACSSDQKQLCRNGPFFFSFCIKQEVKSQHPQALQRQHKLVSLLVSCTINMITSHFLTVDLVSDRILSLFFRSQAELAVTLAKRKTISGL